MRVIIQLLGSLHAALPPWVFALVLIGLLALGARPMYRMSLARQIRRLAGKASQAGDVASRVAAEDEALAIAGDDRTLLVVAGDVAVFYRLTALLKRVVERLEAGPADADLRRLRGALLPEAAKKPGHPIEVALAVQRLLDSGLYEAARTRLDEGLARFPADPDLAALRERLPPG